jgi:hypothetical protein
MCCRMIVYLVLSCLFYKLLLLYFSIILALPSRTTNSEFLADFEDGVAAERGWRDYLAGYSASKAMANRFSVVLSQQNGAPFVAAVCPGWCVCCCCCCMMMVLVVIIVVGCCCMLLSLQQDCICIPTHVSIIYMSSLITLYSHPKRVKTRMGGNKASLSVEAGADGIVWLVEEVRLAIF